MIRSRLYSPLRWLAAVMMSLMLLAIASIAQVPLLMLGTPVVAALFLLSPAVGVFRHNETRLRRASVRLDAAMLDESSEASPGEIRFRLALVNDSDIAAHDVRIRLLIPHAIIPREAGARPLGTLHLGSFGTHWFIDSMSDAIAITLRTAPRSVRESILCPPTSRQDLADLVLPAQARPISFELDYQVSGGNVKATLCRLQLTDRS